MARGTLSLGGTPPAVEPPESGPEFNPDAHYGEVGGVEGVAYVQGKSMFNRAKKYVGPAPKEMWLTPLTAKQEQDRRRQTQVNKKFFGAPKNLIGNAAAIPQTVANAERENAQARAAEARAE